MTDITDLRSDADRWVDDLCDLYERRAFVAASELRTRIETFQRSDLPSIAAREREAAFLSLEYAVELIDLDAKIRCLELRLAHARL